MSLYEDASIALDTTGLTIKDYYRPGRPRTVRFDTMVGAELIPLRVGTGKVRLVGSAPAGRDTSFIGTRGVCSNRTP